MWSCFCFVYVVRLCVQGDAVFCFPLHVFFGGGVWVVFFELVPVAMLMTRYRAAALLVTHSPHVVVVDDCVFMCGRKHFVWRGF